jgi:CRISPR/Cas system endoribonuclease Cas6 (RAMP superfamily)
MLKAAAKVGMNAGVFRFVLVPVQTLAVSATNKANMLRGAFGQAFRRLCCVPQCEDVRACSLAASCPYKNIFEPSPPADARRLSKNQDIPRPFVFRAPEVSKTKYDPGEEFEFELVLIGRALEYLPYFVLAFRELATQGIGLNRAKCELRKVEEVEPLREQDSQRSSVPRIYDSSDQVFHTPRCVDLDSWISDHPINGLANHQISGVVNDQVLKVCFRTPTYLRSDGEVKRQPDFHHLFKRLRDRVNALSTFFGPGPMEADFTGLGQRAEAVRTVSCNVHWVDRFRTSSKTSQRHELSGFVGEAEYQGDMEEFLPWLVLGELVHVGKHTAWGMGRVCMIPMTT